MGIAASIRHAIEQRAFPGRSATYDKNHPNVFFIGQKPHTIACMRYVAEFNESNKVILYAHGNGTDLGQTHGFLKKLCEDIQVDIIAFDYCGYGLSDGDETTEKNCLASMWDVYEYLLSQGVARNQIILYGSSIGTGPCIQLAAILSQRDSHNNLHACLLQGPYTSAIGVFSPVFETTCEISHSCVPEKNPNIFCSFRVVDKIECPVYILHGSNDDVIAHQHAVRLHAKMQHAQKICNLITIAGANHNNIEADHHKIIVDTLHAIICL